MTNMIGQCYIEGWGPQVTVYLETKLVLFCVVVFDRPFFSSVNRSSQLTPSIIHISNINNYSSICYSEHHTEKVTFNLYYFHSAYSRVSIVYLWFHQLLKKGCVLSFSTKQ